jgi:hypothetical protein
MILMFMASSKFQLKTSLIGCSSTSHPDACTYMEHAHPSYAHIVLQMSLTHIPFSSSQKIYAQILHQLDTCNACSAVVQGLPIQLH